MISGRTPGANPMLLLIGDHSHYRKAQHAALCGVAVTSLQQGWAWERSVAVAIASAARKVAHDVFEHGPGKWPGYIDSNGLSK